MSWRSSLTEWITDLITRYVHIHRRKPLTDALHPPLAVEAKQSGHQIRSYPTTQATHQCFASSTRHAPNPGTNRESLVRCSRVRSLPGSVTPGSEILGVRSLPGSVTPGFGIPGTGNPGFSQFLKIINSRNIICLTSM